MITINKTTADCVDTLLTFGALKLFAGEDPIFPTATHRLFLDLLPIHRGRTVFNNPTIEVVLLTEGGTVTRSFVPMSSSQQPNDQEPEYFDGADWQPHLDDSPVPFPSPTTHVRLRYRVDSISLDWRGSRAAPNGKTFWFGLKMSDSSHPGVAVDNLSILIRANAERVVLVNEPCERQVSNLAIGDSWPGFVPN